MDDISDQTISAHFAAFLARGTASQKHQLHTFLVSQPSYSTPTSLVPVEELTVRLEMVEELRKLWEKSLDKNKPFYLSYIQLSVLLVIPINVLQSLREDCSLMWHVLYPQHPLLLLIQGKLSEPVVDNKPKKESPSEFSGSSTKSFRNRRERTKCYFRDQQACILTKAAHPEACHIVPYAVTSNEVNISAYFSSNLIRWLEGPEQELSRVISKESIGSLDKSWNMLCLHPTLHAWWSNCLFGLKCLGLIPNSDGRSTRVQIQFYWMPRNGIKPHNLVRPPYDNTVKEMLQTVELALDGGAGIVEDVQRDSFHKLETGQTFEIVVGNEDATRTKAALDLQWAVVRLSAISGAADVSELSGDLEGDDEGGASVVDTGIMVAEWLEKTTLPESSSQ